MRLFAHAHYDFLALRRKAYVFSGTLISLGILAAAIFAFARGSWLNYGVDFTGGTLVQVHFARATSVGDVRSAVSKEFPEEADITRFGASNEFLVRLPVFQEGANNNVANQLQASLQGTFGSDSVTIVRTEAVGPKVGGELQEKALIAVLFSFALTLIYLAFRFEWRFGVAAVIATLHDILITLGFIAAFRLDVSLPTVAAVLTIIGYSLNDTIIVFDRIRENLKRLGRREEYTNIINRSINETLPRTIMTSGTTLAALFALYILGGEIIRGFAVILIVGIVIGTYSSIFVASPALLEIERRWPRADKRRRARPARAGAGV